MATPAGKPEFCWLTLQIPEIKGIKKIHFISKEGSRTHLGSIIRSGNFFNVQSFFESDAPTVRCVSKETVTLSWKIQRPTKNARIRCTDGGIWRPTMSSDTHEVTVTYNLRHSKKNFEALYCSVDVGRSWVAANYFVVWQDTAKFVEDENSPKDTLAIAGNDRQHTLTWHVSTSEPVTSKPFVCLDNNHLICSGVTSANDPGRCNKLAVASLIRIHAGRRHRRPVECIHLVPRERSQINAEQ
nr:unnamed protein product [Spirometra erinaceieuropaei]